MKILKFFKKLLYNICEIIAELSDFQHDNQMWQRMNAEKLNKIPIPVKEENND